MPLEQQIFAALNGATAAGARVNPAAAMPQGGVVPAITYTRISNAPTVALGGRSNLDEVRVQVDCWDTTHVAVQTLARAVRDLLEAQTFKALMQNDFDAYESDTQLYRWSMDFRCWDRL